jgi:hypothetical protein
MASPLEVFGKTAQRLSRNPLGIIALFIVLVYGIAGIVLGFSSQHLEPCERQPLIWFLVVFPVIVLAAFYRLVTCHHAKLYAPHDFQEDEGFFRAMSPIEQKQRLEEEIREVELASSVDRSDRTTENETDASEIVDAVGVRHAWVLAEEVAIREIESEFGVTVQRQVAYGPDYGFDGIFQYKDKLAILEIKYVRRPNWRPMIESAIKHLQRAKDAVKPARVFVLAIVTDELPITRREAEIQQTRELLKTASLDIDVRVYDFLELKRKYGLTNEVG